MEESRPFCFQLEFQVSKNDQWISIKIWKELFTEKILRIQFFHPYLLDWGRALQSALQHYT